MERITNVRISTLTKVVSLETDITVTSVAMSGAKMVVVDADDNTYELGTITVSNACVVQTVESHPSCGSDTSRANVIANLLRGVDGKDGKDGKTQDLSEYYKKSEVDGKLKQKQDTISNLDTIRANAEKGATAVQPSELAKVATSGNYNDLSDKPYIPAEVTEQKVRDWGFTKNTGNYTKPSSGIPSSDLASEVRTSLGLANSALQSVPSEYITETELEAKKYATKTEVSNALIDKVDKVEGKGLSTEDFTTEFKNKVETSTDIVASQIFLELHAVTDDFQVFSHKRGCEEHNREVCQRLIENCFTYKTPNNEVFFVTINGLRDGIPYMETAILESQAEEVVRASFVKGNNPAQGVSIAASINILSIDVEALKSYVESGEDAFYWKYFSTLVPSIDAIGSEGESDVYVTEFAFERITSNGTAINVSPELVSAIYNKKVIVIPSSRGQNYIATNVFSGVPLKNVSIQMQIVAGTYIYDVTLTANGTAPQTVPTRVSVTKLLSGTLNTINGASIAKGDDMQLVSSISLNGKTYKPSNGAVDLGNIEGSGTYVTTLVYKATSKVENTRDPWSDTTFGAPIIKHEFDGDTGVIYFRGRITTIGISAFASCESLTSITIPDSVFLIDEAAFSGCSNLTSVTMGNGVTSIGEWAFEYCSNLQSITIPDSVTAIGDSLFEGCNSLTSVTISDSVTTIGRWAFSYCTSLTSVYCKATTPPAALISFCYWEAFDDNAPNRKIYVPTKSVEAYKSAEGWSDYVDNIVGYHYDVGLFKTINGESIVGEGDISIGGETNTMISASWGRLVSARDSGELIPGTYYRIIDYVTTTTQEETSSAGNLFDVIVLALDNKTLSEEAYAIQSERDTDGYFANSNLSAWKLWYCLDNDASRFAWADETSGTGVIYRMIDEFDNDIPYDFKNILFTRYELEAPDEYEAQEDDHKWLEQLSKNVRAMFDEGVASYRWAGVELGNRYWEDDSGIIYSVATAERKNFYTFSDITNYKDREVTVDASLSFNCHRNKMGVAKDDAMRLPNNVFFGNNCYFNSLGDNCYYNSFGNSFYLNVFEDYCDSNSFGEDCAYNSFRSFCSYNNFAHYCHDNSFDRGCYCNSFSNDCNSNSIGKDFNCNIFGDYCNNNSFSNGCYYNSFSNNCEYNSFGIGYNHNSLVGNLYRHNTFGDGVEYLHLLNDEQNQDGYNVQNYRIASGTQGTYEEPLVINAERGRNYETTIARNSNGEIVQFCEGDNVGGKNIQLLEGSTIDILEPNKIYVYATYTLSSITINSFSTTDALTEEYVVQFRTFPTVGNITLPSGVMWANGVIPTLEGNTLYELSIVKTHIGETDYFKAVLTPFK